MNIQKVLVRVANLVKNWLWGPFNVSCLILVVSADIHYWSQVLRDFLKGLLLAGWDRREISVQSHVCALVSCYESWKHFASRTFPFLHTSLRRYSHSFRKLWKPGMFKCWIKLKALFLVDMEYWVLSHFVILYLLFAGLVQEQLHVHLIWILLLFTGAFQSVDRARDRFSSSIHFWLPTLLHLL